MRLRAWTATLLSLTCEAEQSQLAGLLTLTRIQILPVPIYPGTDTSTTVAFNVSFAVVPADPVASSPPCGRSREDDAF